jgi:hypothetical protein
MQALFGNIGRPSLGDGATGGMNNPARMNRQ